MPERKYRYRRVAPGLILLPANDGETWIVVGRYEDGPTWGLLDEPRDFEAWGWGRLPASVMERVRAMRDPEAITEALRDHVFDNTWPRHKTMGAAIDAALAATPPSSREAASDD